MPDIRLPVPPNVHDELARLAAALGHQSLEIWTQSLLVQAAEEARPALKSSGMWSRDTSIWYGQLLGDK